MGLLTAGYWPTTYWPKDYWVDDYWPDYGTVIVAPITLPYVATVYDKPATIGIVQDIPLTSSRVYDKPRTL